MKYDVFISCKSEDYNIGRQVYEFLTNYRGLDISVFMADKELGKRGNTNYGKIIDEALDSSTHLIIVSSNANFLKEEISSYVYEEWHTFVEEIRSGRKKGNIMTIFTENVKLEEVPIALRNRQSFPFTEYSPIVNYLKIGDDNINETTSYKNCNVEVSGMNDVEIDLDYDDAVDFINDGELQEALRSLQISFKCGNKKTLTLFNKILFQNFGKIDWDDDSWSFFEKQSSAGLSFANLAFFYKLSQSKETHNKAIAYLKTALEDKENGYAFLCEGITRERGIGMRPNLRSAMKRYEQAFGMGVIEAGSYLAEMYLKGNSGLEIDAQKAKKILQNGCDNDDARSYFVLAQLYTPDTQLSGAYEKVIELYQKAISLQLYEGYISLGNLYEKSLNIDGRLDKALHCYFEAIKHGIKDGHAYIAKLYWKLERFEEAKTEAETGEKNSNVLSISTLGEFYEEGIPNMDAMIIEHKPDYTKAWNYYLKAFQIGGGISDAISLARLYVKKEYRPSDISWDTIENYLKEGIKVPDPQAIELMVDALKQNGREEEAVTYIKLGAEIGSLPLMYEFGIRSLSSNTGEGLKFLEDSGLKGYEPSISRLLEYYRQRRIKAEYEKWMEIANNFRMEVSISDYSYYLYSSKRDVLWDYLKKQVIKNEKESLFWMAYYLWKKLPVPTEDIQWVMDKYNARFESIVSYKTQIYEIYADLLMRYSSELSYNEYIDRVSQIYSYRGDYLKYRRELNFITTSDKSIDFLKKIKPYADNPELPNEWRARFKELMLKSLTTKMRIILICDIPSILSDFLVLLDNELFECIAVSNDSLNKDVIVSYKPQIIINCNNFPVALESEDIGEVTVVGIDSIGSVRTAEYSTYEEWSFFEKRFVNELRKKLILLKRSEFGVPAPDYTRFSVLNCEDVETNFKVISILFKNKISLLWARDGIEALSLIERIWPDLILMDIRMPGMDGLDTTRILKEIAESKGMDIPIVGLSSYAFDIDIRNALMLGMDGFISKPFKPEQLIDLVITTLEKNYILNYLFENK